MLEDGADTIDLFSAKTTKGWWMMIEESDDGIRKEQVDSNSLFTYTCLLFKRACLFLCFLHREK